MEATAELTNKLASASDAYLNSYYEGLRPVPDINVWQWADAKRVIAGEAAAEPGPYRTSRTPYLREPQTELSPQSLSIIIAVMKATQLGWTEVGNNLAGHTIDINPCAMAMYFPVDNDASEHSKTKLNPSIEATECLREKIIDVPGAKGKDTIHTKIFPGGILYLMGAKSPRNFRHKSIKLLMGDEIDEWPYDVGGQGDPTELLMKRMDTFSQHGGKVYLLSTPTIHKLSKIERWFDDSDQRYYYVPCPLCGEYQRLIWKQLKYKRDEDYNLIGEPEYECVHCKKRFGEHHKTVILEAGEWRAHKPGRKIRGYHLSSLYSPLGWLSWLSMAEEWLRAHKDNDITKKKVFINTRLAETWKEDTESHNPHVLYKRREAYPANVDVPAGACLLTSFTDVQKDRLEVEVKGWGPGFENWGIEHHVIYGSPLRESTWEEHDAYIFDSVFMHESGLEMKIRAYGLDTGYEQGVCYEYIKRTGHRVLAFKGKGGDRLVVTGPTKDKITNVKLWTTGTDTVKELIFGWLSLKTPGRGYCHYNIDYTEEFFDQVTGEIAVIQKGRRVFIPRRAGQPVEGLDLFVGNRAVLEILRVNLDRTMKTMERKIAAMNKPPGPGKSELRSRKKRVKKPFATRGL